jgi:hypothetical protein
MIVDGIVQPEILKKYYENIFNENENKNA